MASISGMGNVHPVFNFDPFVMNKVEMFVKGGKDTLSRDVKALRTGTRMEILFLLTIITIYFDLLYVYFGKFKLKHISKKNVLP